MARVMRQAEPFDSHTILAVLTRFILARKTSTAWISWRTIDLEQVVRTYQPKS